MIRWLVESSMKLRYLVIILAAMLLVFGFAQLQQMPVNVFPEIDPPHVEVQTEALGLSAEGVEAFITVPMEADLLNGVAWLDQIYSESVAGLSSILLIFEPGTDPIRARQMVQERLTQAHALPNVSQPPVMLQPLSSTNRAMIVGLSSDELSPVEMGVLSRWIIKPRLLGVPGVANVAIWGQRERQLQVQVDPVRLHANGVTLDQIIETTGEALWVSPLSYLESSTPGTAGWIDTPNQRLSVRHLLPISTPEDLAKVTIVDNETLLLGDVATVVEDHQPLIGDAALSDGPGYLLVIEKFPGANTLEVTRGVEEALAALQPGLQGMEIDTSVFRPANYIETALDNLGLLLAIGFALIALVLLAFYFQWRTALISLFAIPLSLVVAGLMLYLTGATFNMMLLAGLALALVIVIDNAVAEVDAIAQRLRRRAGKGDQESPMAAILEAVVEARGPLGFAFLIILLAVLPVFFLPGLTGTFIRPLAVSYILAIIASVLVALIVTPALSVVLLSKASLQRESPLTIRLQRLYRRLLGRTVGSSMRVIIVAVALMVIGLVTLLFLNVDLLPSLTQRDLLIQLEAAPGTSRPEMNRIMAQAGSELRAIPGVNNLGSHVGRAITGDAVVGINSGEFWISIDPAADYDETLTTIREVVGGYPGLEWAVRTYRPERLGQAVTGPDQDIVVRIYGHELGVLRDKAREVVSTMDGIEGVVDARAQLYTEEPQVEIEVDLAAAEQHGIKPGDVRRQATTLLSGIQVGSLFEEQKVFDVVVWGVPELRSNLTNIRELLIDTPAGNQITLQEVADVRIVPAATVIERDAVSRYVDVGANVSGRSLSAVLADVESGVERVQLPFEYHIEVLSDSLSLQGSGQSLLAITIAALIGMFLLMQASLISWRLSIAVFLTLPVALVGGVIAAFLGGRILSIGSLFGFLAILAITVRNGMVLLSRLRAASQSGEEGDAEQIVAVAGEQVGQILATALATFAILLPLLIGGKSGGVEFVQPMAIVIVGGLVTSALLNLFIVPALYVRWPSPLMAEARRQPSVQPTLDVV